MKDYITRRAKELACYIIEHNATVRDAAKKFDISKSTVHKDVTERLEEADPGLAARVKMILDVNLSQRHIRGGIATKNKFRKTHNGRTYA
ncbi:MAG: sporulation transcriptional regulator SpoIIID [Firmicutes bacterium]|nr:sporulation transcriptional regulator SpoIIID [Bacillota bacterium]